MDEGRAEPQSPRAGRRRAAANGKPRHNGGAKMKPQARQPTTAAANFDVEIFAKNLARAVEEAGKALAAYLQPREEGRARDGFAEELTEIIKTLSEVAHYWLADPQRTVKIQGELGQAYLDLWRNAVRRLAGEDTAPVVEPDPRDKRFSDPEWSSNQFYDFLKQAYLLSARWADQLVKQAKDIDPETRQRADFYMRQIVNALSPSNFVLTNPELLRETFASNAANLARGMHHLAEDIKAGGGDIRIRQTDLESFKVGENLATTPGKVILQNPVMQLIQYAPTTETVLKRPLLIVPPWINKYYILDLTPERSFIKWCVDQGLTVFVISWVNPDARHAKTTFEDYMTLGPLAAIDAIVKATGETKINAIGYCVGGTLLAATLAYLAQKRKARIASATLFASQVDFTRAGDLKVFVSEAQLKALEERMAECGYLDAGKMQNTFNLLRSNDLIWPYVINNYLKGREPLPFDILYWNADSTRLPAANHSFYLRKCYLENALSKGKMELGGVKLDLKKIKIPIYNLATREDHIAPAESVYRGSRFFGGPVKFVLAGSGHIAGVINPPGQAKYQYWTGEAPHSGTLEAWLAKATEHPGSWWPDWLAWLKSHDSRTVPARPVGGGGLQPIEDAPGSYVKVRS
jgi:polyhydroxyalkanoate synthase